MIFLRPSTRLRMPYTYFKTKELIMTNFYQVYGIGNALVDSIEARTRVQYGLREPQGDTVSGFAERINCLPRE